MAALCYLHSNWYGLLINWTNKTNKSNLMLITLKPGRNAIPWLGDLQDLTLIPRKSDTSGNHIISYFNKLLTHYMLYNYINILF